MTNAITQFKLTNNDEIVCEIVEWDEGDVVITKAMRIIQVDDPSKGVKYYFFKPFMTFQNNEDCIQQLNSAHIVSQAKPTVELLEYYNTSLKEHAEVEREDADIDELLDSLGLDKLEKNKKIIH